MNSINVSDVYSWRREAGNKIMQDSFYRFKQLYENKVNVISWDISQLKFEQNLLQPIHKKYFGNHLGLSPHLTAPKYLLTPSVDLLNYPSRIAYACVEMGYTVQQGYKP